MKATHMSTVLSGAQFSHHRDLFDLLPHYPRLIPELIFIPENANRVAVYGARQPRILNCAQGMTVLAAFLGQLDGSRSLEDLLVGGTSLSQENALGMLSLLFRYGFLEEGDGLDRDDRSALASYCGRLVDSTRIYANRTAALKAARSRRLVLVCPADVEDVLRQVIAPVVASVSVMTDPQQLSENSWDEALVLFDGSEQDAQRRDCATALHRAGIRYFSCFTGADATVVGPLTLPGISASYQCALAQCHSPLPASDRQEVTFRAVYAAHELLQLVLGLSSESYLNKVVIHSHRGEGDYTLGCKIARIPGTPLGGLAGAQALLPGESVFTAWLHHTGTRLPPRAWLPPRSHQMHFTLDNLNRHASRPARLHGQQQVMLPPLQHDSGYALPWLADAQQIQPLTLLHLGELLRNATGYQQTADGELRRIAPSGGQLISCDLMVVVRQPLPELPSGVWFYQGEEHWLVKIDAVDCGLLDKVLHQPSAPLSLIVTANLSRVRGKYNDFSYNIVNLDAGVVNQYCALSAATLGWTLFEEHHADLQWLAELLYFNQQDNPHVVCQVMHLGAGGALPDASAVASYETVSKMVAVSHFPRQKVQVSPLSAATHRCCQPLSRYSGGASFDALLLRRRARYEYGATPPQAALLRALIGLSHASLAQNNRRGMPALKMEPWLILPEDSGELTAGIYQCASEEAQCWIKRDSGFERHQLADCINQSAFHHAGALLVWVADLEQTLQQHGASGYRMQLQNAASAAMQCWLAALDCGLCGTLAGGFIEEGLMRHAATDGYRESALFCLVLAQPDVAEVG